MRIYLLVLIAILAACSDDKKSDYKRKDLATDNSLSSEPNVDDKKVDVPKKNEEIKPGDDVLPPPVAMPPPVPMPPPVNTPPTPGDFVVDPETLSFPVVFHIGTSTLWETEEKLRPVIAEAQRILQLAKIEILPTYTKDAKPTAFLDVYFVPQVPNQPGVNGISFGTGALEIYVIDNVRLTKVADQRPSEALAPRYFKGVKPGDKVPVSAEQAEQGRTSAHEIGHQLGLPHRQNSTNLLASGTTGWTLNAAEIATMRKTAVDKFKAKFMKVLSFTDVDVESESSEE